MLLQGVLYLYNLVGHIGLWAAGWRPMLYPMARRAKLVIRTLWVKSSKLSFLLALFCVPYHIRLIKLPSNVLPPMYLHPQFHSAFLASSGLYT